MVQLFQLCLGHLEREALLPLALFVRVLRDLGAVLLLDLVVNRIRNSIKYFLGKLVTLWLPRWS